MLFTKSALNCVLGPLLSATPGVRTNKATMSLQRRLHRRKWPPSAVRTRPLIRSPKLFDRRIELQTASPCQSPGDRLRGDPPSPRVSPRFADRRPRCITPEQGGTLNMSPAELVWGSYASRVCCSASRRTGFPAGRRKLHRGIRRVLPSPPSKPSPLSALFGSDGREIL